VITCNYVKLLKLAKKQEEEGRGVRPPLSKDSLRDDEN
jgi:hypothetical protein